MLEYLFPDVKESTVLFCLYPCTPLPSTKQWSALPCSLFYGASGKRSKFPAFYSPYTLSSTGLNVSSLRRFVLIPNIPFLEEELHRQKLFQPYCSSWVFWASGILKEGMRKKFKQSN